MKKVYMFFIFLMMFINVKEIDASTGLLKSITVIECDGKLYGKHGQDNHYHLAEETEDGKYKAVGDSLGTDWTCSGESKDINSEKELESEIVEFEKCVDGDTAIFKTNGKSIKFRFLGIDTPETVHPTKEVEAYGKNASEYTCARLKEANIIKVEYEESKIDKYDRYLAWIFLDDSLLQEELVKAGYAEVAYIYGTYKYTQKLCETQMTAIEAKNGMWNDGSKEEGYCSTLRPTPVSSEETTSTDDTTNAEEKLDPKTYMTEALTALAVLVVGIIIKKIK